MPIKRRASIILGAFEKAQTEIVGKAVVLTDGKAGTVEKVCLDELHGLRISIKGHRGKEQTKPRDIEGVSRDQGIGDA